MSGSALTLFVVGVVVATFGAVAVVALSARIRREIQLLVGAFDATERKLQPLVAAVRTDRERLSTRLACLSEAGSEVDPSGR